MKYRLEDGSEAEIGWDIDGWDWADQDYSWLSSQTHLPDDGFFIHGGYIRHQRHIPYRDYTVDNFLALIKEFAEGLENVQVVVSEDTGSGDHGFWVEGVRPPNQTDVEALIEVRRRRDHEDERNYKDILKRHPNWNS